MPSNKMTLRRADRIIRGAPSTLLFLAASSLLDDAPSGLQADLEASLLVASKAWPANTKQIIVSWPELGAWLTRPGRRLVQSVILDSVLEHPSPAKSRSPEFILRSESASVEYFDLQSVDDDYELDILTRSACWTGIESFSFQPSFLDGGISVLIGRKRPPHLRELRIGGHGVGASGCRALLSSTFRGVLTELAIYASGDDEATEVLKHLEGDTPPALKRISISGNISSGVLHQLGRHSRLTHQIRALSLPRCSEPDESAASLAAASRFRNLEELDLANADISAAGLQEHFSSTTWNELRRLELSGNAIGDEGVRWVAAADTPKLGDLLLVGCEISSGGMAHFDVNARLGAIRHLDLSDNEIDAQAARHLADSPCFAQCEQLAINSNPLTDEGAAALAASSMMRGLRSLSVVGTNMSSTGVATLAHSARRLAAFNVSGNRLGPAGGAELAAGDQNPAMDSLGIGYCDLGNEGISALVASARFPNLMSLEIPGNTITAAGLSSLANSAVAESLFRLSIDNNPVGDVGLARILESGSLSQLVSLSLLNCGITEASLNSLARAPLFNHLKELRIWLLRSDNAKVQGLAALAPENEALIVKMRQLLQ
jgi:Ran GTPase-activating protein (RanGAP) involved in mRNA processing and transport